MLTINTIFISSIIILESFFSNKIYFSTILSIFLLGSCLSFLFFNFPKAKLFLGDSGSLLLGFILSFLLIFLTNNIKIHPILLAWSVSIFVFEFLSTNIDRLLRKKNIFKAGLDHLHYKLLRSIKSIFLVDITIFLLNIFLFIIGYTSFYYVNSFFSLITFILLFTIFFCFRRYFLK